MKLLLKKHVQIRSVESLQPKRSVSQATSGANRVSSSILHFTYMQKSPIYQLMVAQVTIFPRNIMGQRFNNQVLKIFEQKLIPIRCFWI